MPFPDEVLNNGDGTVSFVGAAAANNPVAQAQAQTAAELAAVGQGDPTLGVGADAGGPWPAGLAAAAPEGAPGLPTYLTDPSRFVPSPEVDPQRAAVQLADPGTAPTVFNTSLALADEHKKIKCPKCDTVQSASNDKCSNCGHDLTEARKAKFANLSQDEPEHQAVIYNTQGLTLAVEGDDGLLWKVACKTGTLALSPGPGQTDSERPLVLDDALFNDMVLSAQEKAFPYITVPETHANGALENTGYVRAWDVLDRDALLMDARLPEKYRPLISLDPPETRYLLAGIDFTEPDVKAKAIRGTIPDTSIGVKFNYRNKRTGKLYRAAWEHLALTPMPWVDGLVPFGLSQSKDGVVDADAAIVPYDGVYMPEQPPLDLACPDSIDAETWDKLSVAGQIRLYETLDLALPDFLKKKVKEDDASPDKATGDDAKIKCPKCDAMNPAAAKKCKRCKTSLVGIKGGNFSVDDDEGEGLDLAFEESLHPRLHGRFTAKGAMGDTASIHTEPFQNGTHNLVVSHDFGTNSVALKPDERKKVADLVRSGKHGTVKIHGDAKVHVQPGSDDKHHNIHVEHPFGSAAAEYPKSDSGKLADAIHKPDQKAGTTLNKPDDWSEANRNRIANKHAPIPTGTRPRRHLSVEPTQDAPSASSADLPKPVEVGSLPGELHASQRNDPGDTAIMPTATVEDVLAQQQAELEASQQRIADLEAQLTLSQGTLSQQGEQLHEEAVNRRVRQLQAANYPPAVCLAAKQIMLGDKSRILNGGGDEGLALSVQVPKVGSTTGEQETRTLKSPTDVVEFLLSAVPTGDGADVARMASLTGAVSELHASAHTDVNSEEARKKAVEENEKQRHPERFDKDGNRK